MHELRRVHLRIPYRREDCHCLIPIQCRCLHQSISQRKWTANRRQKRTHPVLSITIEPSFAVSTENKILYLLRRRIDRLRRESDRLILPVPEECIERARQEMIVAET